MKQRLLTFREAAVALKWVDPAASDAECEAAGRRLGWTILVRERETGKRIATRLGHRVESGGKAHQRVTLSAIYRHFPELRKDKPELLAEELRDYLDERLGERVAEEVDALMGPKFRDVDHVANRARDQAAKVLKRVETLEAAVAELRARAPEPARKPQASG